MEKIHEQLGDKRWNLFRYGFSLETRRPIRPFTAEQLEVPTWSVTMGTLDFHKAMVDVGLCDPSAEQWLTLSDMGYRMLFQLKS